MFHAAEKSRFRSFFRKNTFAVTIGVVAFLALATAGIGAAVKKTRSDEPKDPRATQNSLLHEKVKNRAAPTLVIGFMPSSNVEQVHQLSLAIASRISQTEKFEVRSVVGASYGDLADAVRDGEIHAVFMSPVLYVKNDFHKTHKPLLRVARKKPIRDAYYGAYVVKQDNKDIASLADMCDVTIGYTDLDSSSGYVYPKLMLSKYLKETNRLKKCKIREVFLDGHKGVLDAVMLGQVDVGATFANDARGASGAWKQLGPYPIRAIATTKSIPSDALFVPKTMSIAMQKKISDAFRGLLETQEGRAMVDKLFNAQDLVPSNGTDYDAVVKVVEEFRTMTGGWR